MKAIVLDKEVVTRMTKMTWRKDSVRQLLANVRKAWFYNYIELTLTINKLESDLGSDYIVEEPLEEVRKERIRLEHLLGFDKEKVIEPD